MAVRVYAWAVELARHDRRTRFSDQVSRKPSCPAAQLAAAGILTAIAQAPFAS